MSISQALNTQLEELEIEENEQKARFQEELIMAITKYLQNLENPRQKQINILKRENKRLTKIIEELPNCRCTNRPFPCNTCGKMFKNKRTRLVHLRNTHYMTEMPFNSQPHTANYPYTNFYTNDNNSTYTPPTPFTNYNL